MYSGLNEFFINQNHCIKAQCRCFNISCHSANPQGWVIKVSLLPVLGFIELRGGIDILTMIVNLSFGSTVQWAFG